MQQRAEQPRPLGSDGDERPVRLSRCGRLVTAARRVDPALLPDDPGRILSALDVPRGAWKRGGEWAAYGGSAATVEPAAEDGGRFRAVREQGASLAGRAARPGSGPDGGAAGNGADASPLPRLYGGFSFHDVPDVSGSWSGFPTACFRVPRREVRVEGDAGWLLATRAAGDGSGAEDAAKEARLELRRLEDRLRGSNREVDGTGDAAAPPPGIESVTPPDADAATDPGGERERWRRGVEKALDDVRSGRLEKVVLARTLDVPDGVAVAPIRAFRRLRFDNPRSALFFLQPGPDTAFLGASPELLGSARGSVFRATAVAGSVPRGGSREEDAALGRRLLESEKDRREQAIVAEEIRRCLDSRLGAVSVGSARLLKLARIQHLQSSVEGRLPQSGAPGNGNGNGDGGPHLLDLIADLHPTPAVCGRPRDRALATLRESEPFERGWYAAPVGWFDPAGRGEFVPGLRSGVLHGGRWRLFAGAGIVEGSDPDREWEETGVKFVPMLRALGAGSGS